MPPPRTKKNDPRPRRAPNQPPRIGIALAGGGPLGAVYEIGALAAIEESIEGLDLNRATIYVGISAGGIIASGLANGFTPHEMCRSFVESSEDGDEHNLFKPELLLKPAWSELRKRFSTLPKLMIYSLVDYGRGAGKTSLASAFERLKEALPTGIFSGSSIHEFLEKTFSEGGRTNDFRRLRARLVLVATDLDSGQSVRFGQENFDHVPISKAAQASAAIPGFFPPVEIDGHHFVDGALKRTLHASIALEEGVDVLICVNPIVPYNAKITHAPGKLAERGLLPVLSQTLRAIIHSRLEIGMSNYADTYPNSAIFLFEPSEEDAEIFFTNLFNTNNRCRICENAYQHTRKTLWKQHKEIQRKLAPHGLRLKLSVLQDTHLSLVKKPRTGTDRFSIGKLHDALDDLEHYLKVSAG